MPKLPPKPYKLKCPKCGFKKIITEDDMAGSNFLLHHCDKCAALMEKTEFNFFEKMLGKDLRRQTNYYRANRKAEK